MRLERKAPIELRLEFSSCRAFSEKARGIDNPSARSSSSRMDSTSPWASQNAHNFVVATPGLCVCHIWN